MWYLLLILFLIILFGYLFWSYARDKKERKRRTVESLGNELWKEIDKERQDSVEKGKAFRRILKKARDEDRRR